LRQLVFWAETVAKLGKADDRPPTSTECAARRKLLTSGDWPMHMQSVEKVHFGELGQRFADFYKGGLYSLSSD